MDERNKKNGYRGRSDRPRRENVRQAEDENRENMLEQIMAFEDSNAFCA